MEKGDGEGLPIIIHYFDLGNGFAGDFFGAHGGVIDKACHDDGGLYKVVVVYPVVAVHVGVVGATAVFKGVLYELEAGYAYFVKRNVVGRAGAAYGGESGTNVFEWRHPSVKNGSYLLVALHVYAPYAPCAVVKVKVGRYFWMLGGKFHCFSVGKVIFNISS